MKGKTYRHVEQDRRYWRRRGNLKVRKARLTRKSFRWTGLVLFNCLLLWAGWTACDRVWDMACTAKEFRLRDIGVQGIHQTPKGSLEQALTPFYRNSVLTLDLEEVAAAAEAHPWVARASVKRILPCGIRVRIEEREAVARFRDGDRTLVVDRTGFIQDVSGLVHPEEFGGLPVISGISDGGEDRRTVRIRRGLLTLQSLQSQYPEWSERLAAIDLAQDDRITVTSGNSGARLFLDPENVLRNFEQYLALRDQIHNRIGQVDYFDLRWKDRIALMPGQS